MDLSVVIPIYNEASNITLLFERLEKTCSNLVAQYEYIFINDGSKDDSISIIRELATQHPYVRYIDFSRNFGHQIAVSAGLDHALGNAVAIIDADLQDPPELIGEMYHKMKEGYEVVYARRRTRKGESWFKLWTAKMFYKTLASITSVTIPVDTGDFRIIDKKIVDILKNMPEKHKYLRGQIAWIGFRQTHLFFDRDERHGGETGYTLKKMLQLAMDGITAFSNFPLKIVTFFGTIVSIFAFIMAIYALASRFIWEDYVQGWTSLIISVLFIGGVQMIAIGILGEYISRINSDVRDRPLYIIKDKK